MNIRNFIVLTLVAFALYSCEKSITIAPKASRYIAAEHISKINGQENISKGLKQLLHEEQNLHNKDLWGAGAFSSNINPEYVPENNPKFPLPYYLIPIEDAHFLAAESIDLRVADQLVMKISGKKHYKLFVHPESEAHYDFLKNSYNYIGPNQTEFMASPTSSYRSLVVWNMNNAARKPFIAKVSLDKNVIGSIDRLVSENEVERSIANQRALDRIGSKTLEQHNLKIFPESAGLTLLKKPSGAPEKLGGQLIREIPDEIINGEKKWLSFSALMSPNNKPAPLIMEVIKKSGLSSYDFFKTYMIENYMRMFEEISFKQGMNFEPHSQNLVFETTADFRPTGNWVLRDFGGVWPDIIAMAKNKGPSDVYMEKSSATKYKLRGGRSNYISSYVFFYKRQVFDLMLDEVAKHDSDLTSAEIRKLKQSIDKQYVKMINHHLKLNLDSAPNMNNYKQIEELVLANTSLDSSVEKKELKESPEIRSFIENKKDKAEWIGLTNKNGKSRFFLTDHGLYEVSGNKVVGVAFFNKDELAEYKANKKMLPSLSPAIDALPVKASCVSVIKEFFKGAFQ